MHEKTDRNSPLKLLLVYPDFVEETKRNRNIPGNYSEGLASISAVLKAAGYAVSLLHLTWMPDRDEFLSNVRKEAPDVLGFTMRTTAMGYVSEMAGWLDEEMPDVHVSCGGYHPTLVPDEVLAIRGVDSVCVGEGEYPLRDLMDSLRDGVARRDIESMYFKSPDGSVVRNPVRPMTEDLDELPFPDLSIFDYKKLRTGLIDTAMVMVSRGCLFSCTYCGNSQFRNVYPNRKKYARFRSPANAIRV
ncbi:MAG: cobalamin-dependent protein, partial [Clostridiales Family XIII bacterium]|nr:cobalamin-dependent protein [Clostridiales Family XIII bacterium]